MAIAVFHAVTGGNESSTAETTPAATAFVSTTGNTVLMFVEWYQGTIPSITDTAGNAYSAVSGAAVNSGNQVVAYICENATGNAANVVQANANRG